MVLPPDQEEFYPLIVNPARREYIDLNTLPAGLDRTWPLVGWPGEVLGPLIGHWDGRWMGDPIILAASDALPNPAGLQTATLDQPHRNLFEQAWDEFEDVTPALLTNCLRSPTGYAPLCRPPGTILSPWANWRSCLPTGTACLRLSGPPTRQG